MLSDEVETVGELIYHGHRESAGGGCEAAVTVRIKYRWVKFMERGELLNGRFPKKLNGKHNEKHNVYTLCKASNTVLK